MPLLTTFLKSYARPYLGIVPSSGQEQDTFPSIGAEEDELVERETRARFKKMCEGYFDSVSKKLVIEHKVCLHMPLENGRLCPFTVS